jgi:hypothetical protein
LGLVFGSDDAGELLSKVSPLIDDLCADVVAEIQWRPQQIANDRPAIIEGKLVKRWNRLFESILDRDYQPDSRANARPRKRTCFVHSGLLANEGVKQYLNWLENHSTVGLNLKDRWMALRFLFNDAVRHVFETCNGDSSSNFYKTFVRKQNKAETLYQNFRSKL